MPTTIPPFQSRGAGIHCFSGKKRASAIQVHPMRPCGSVLLPRAFPILRICRRSSERLRTPLASPKVAHASRAGRIEKPAKKPNPTIAFAPLSLKKKGVPELNSPRGIVEGRQKIGVLWTMHTSKVLVPNRIRDCEVAVHAAQVTSSGMSGEAPVNAAATCPSGDWSSRCDDLPGAVFRRLVRAQALEGSVPQLALRSLQVGHLRDEARRGPEAF